jgi:peptide/nickel transport system permease protein
MRRLAIRVLSGLVMVFVVASLTFFLVHMIPGNPVLARYETLIEQGYKPAQALALTESMYGFIPHQPLWQQYLDYVGQLAHLNLGQSILYSGVPVGHIILAALPWTVGMVSAGLILSFVFGLGAGVYAAIARNRWTGSATTMFSTLLHGIPQYMVALVLAFVFTTLWVIFPFGAPYDAAIKPALSGPFLGSLAYHAVLPVAAYTISSYGAWALSSKSSVISVLGDDYILAAELRGLKPFTRMGYVARNSILPLFTTLTLQIGFMFGGAVIIEEIFDYPGLGYLIINSTTNHDYPLMDGTFLLITVAVIAANILADLVYTWIDPRIRA